MSRNSSIRVATESRIDREDVAEISMLRPRPRRSAASDTSRRGGNRRLCFAAGKCLDPVDAANQLQNLPEACQHPDQEHRDDQPV